MNARQPATADRVYIGRVLLWRSGVKASDPPAILTSIDLGTSKLTAKEIVAWYVETYSSVAAGLYVTNTPPVTQYQPPQAVGA